jgi:hypothetical protein
MNVNLTYTSLCTICCRHIFMTTTMIFSKTIDAIMEVSCLAKVKNKDITLIDMHISR